MRPKELEVMGRLLLSYVDECNAIGKTASALLTTSDSSFPFTQNQQNPC